MLLGAMLVNALHAPLEDGEVAFESVGVDVAAHVLALDVANHAMLGKLVLQVGVLAGLIGHNARLAGDFAGVFVKAAT